MKKLFYLGLALAVCPGCAPSYVKVLEKKGPTSPFTNIFTIYVSEACNFSLADSTGYNICLRAGFDDKTAVADRGRVERQIAGSLATKGTAIVSASDWLGVTGAGSSGDDSYDYFKRLLDSLHVDGILVVQQRYLEKEYYRNPVGGGLPVGKSGSVTVSPESSINGELDNVTFECYLVQPANLNTPVWKAELQTKGAATTHELSRSMTRALAKSLVEEGYIVRR